MRTLLFPVRFLYSLYGLIVLFFTCTAFGLAYRFVIFLRWPSLSESVPRAWARTTMRAVTRCRIEGLENLPRGPCALFANHASFFDIVALQLLPRNMRFTAKRLFFKLPMFSGVLRARGDIMMDKTSGGARQDTRAMVQAIEDRCSMDTLEAWKGDGLNRVLVVYAEGTRARDGQLKPFKTRNIARRVLKAGLPIVPVAIAGTYTLWPPGRFLFDFSTVRIILTPPVDSGEVGEVLERAHAQVAKALARV